MARSRPVILDDDDPLPRRAWEPREASRDAFEWGLASSIIGATLLILAPLVVLLVMASARPSIDDYSGSHSDTTKLEILAYIGVIGAVIFCIVGFLFGRHGVSRARSEQTSAGIPVTGMLLCLAAVFVWLLSAIVVLGRGASW